MYRNIHLKGSFLLNKPVYHRTSAEIDLAAIRHNFDILKAKLPPHVKVLSIVKADAYGHGAASSCAKRGSQSRSSC